jgi:hypothetical protein
MAIQRPIGPARQKSLALMPEQITMDGGDLSEQIARLEAQIEDHADAIERCRKIGLAAKAAISVGGVVIVAVLFGLINFDPTAMIAALAAVIGGAVVFGSNASTQKQTTAALKAAEALRAELIAQIELRLVGNGRDEHAMAASPPRTLAP